MENEIKDFEEVQVESKQIILKPTLKQKKKWLKKSLSAFCKSKEQQIDFLFNIVYDRIYENRKQAIWNHDKETENIYNAILKEYKELTVKKIEEEIDKYEKTKYM